MNGWMPSGVGLPQEAKEIVEAGNLTVHLRLENGSECYPKTACTSRFAFGQWWTGKADEVTCTACLEMVHA